MKLAICQYEDHTTQHIICPTANCTFGFGSFNFVFCVGAGFGVIAYRGY